MQDEAVAVESISGSINGEEVGQGMGRQPGEVLIFADVINLDRAPGKGKRLETYKARQHDGGLASRRPRRWRARGDGDSGLPGS